MMHMLFSMQISRFVSLVRTFVRLRYNCSLPLEEAIFKFAGERRLVSKSRLLLIARKLNTMLLRCFLGGAFLPFLKKIEKSAEAIGTF